MDTDTIIVAVIAIIPGLVGVILGIATMRQTSRKTTLEFLQSENERMWKRNQELQDEIDELREWVVNLQEQVRKLGDVPIANRTKRKEQP